MTDHFSIQKCEAVFHYPKAVSYWAIRVLKFDALIYCMCSQDHTTEAHLSLVNQKIKCILGLDLSIIKKLDYSCPFECRVVKDGSPFKQSQVLIRGKVIQTIDENEILVDIGFPIVVQKENEIPLEIGDCVEALGFGIVEPPLEPISVN